MRYLLIVLCCIAVATSCEDAQCHIPTRSRDPDGFMNPTVTLKSGLTEGTRVILPSSEAIVEQFLGIPFAQSPPERFSPPKPVAKWKGTYDGRSTKPACIQQFAYPKPNHDINRHIFNNPPSRESEDCLYLNVYRPQTPGEGKAVLFWLYPGGLQFGDASRPVYNASILSAFHNVVVVTPNFRSNVFGFSNSPELPLESQNAGFLDQRMALSWVKQNIADFGGSPDRITLFGNSAGGTSIDRLITTWPVDPPFSAAIIQSGQASYAPYAPMDGSVSWEQLSDEFKCHAASSPIACLREKPAEAIKDYIEKTGLLFTPVTDNVTQLSTSDARKARKERNIAMVPVLIGSNGQEGSAFWRQAPNELDGFLSFFFAKRPDLVPLLKNLYPLGPMGYESQYARLTAIFTDLVFTCPTALWAKANAEAGLPTWRYFYNASFPDLAPLPKLGAYHTGELPLIFGTYPRANETAAAYAMSKFMQNTWTSFAKNPIGGPGWSKIGLFEHMNVAYIDESASGFVVTDSTVADSKCWAFRELYDDLDKPPFATFF